MTFAEKVLKVVSKIPRGRVMTYKDVAKAAGKPSAARAVGNILHNNPRPIVVPCHRVVKSDGRVGWYVNGAKKKVRLLRKEGVRIHNGKAL